jgi:hypothetical protein
MIEFIFSSFFTFIGTVILLYVCGEIVIEIVKSIRK